MEFLKEEKQDFLKEMHIRGFGNIIKYINKEPNVTFID